MWLWDDAWCWLMSYQMRGVRVRFSTTWVLVHSVYNLVDVWYIMSTRVHSCITFFAFANIRVRTCNLLLQYTSQKTLSFWFEYATDCTIISAVNYEYYNRQYSQDATVVRNLSLSECMLVSIICGFLYIAAIYVLVIVLEITLYFFLKLWRWLWD